METERLLQVVRRDGPGKWKRMTTLFPGKNQLQIREKWVNIEKLLAKKGMPYGWGPS